MFGHRFLSYKGIAVGVRFDFRSVYEELGFADFEYMAAQESEKIERITSVGTADI